MFCAFVCFVPAYFVRLLFVHAWLVRVSCVRASRCVFCALSTKRWDGRRAGGRVVRLIHETRHRAPKGRRDARTPGNQGGGNDATDLLRTIMDSCKGDYGSVACTPACTEASFTGDRGRLNTQGSMYQPVTASTTTLSCDTPDSLGAKGEHRGKISHVSRPTPPRPKPSPTCIANQSTNQTIH